jgi:hypothetical protein
MNRDGVLLCHALTRVPSPNQPVYRTLHAREREREREREGGREGGRRGFVTQ